MSCNISPVSLVCVIKAGSDVRRCSHAAFLFFFCASSRWIKLMFMLFTLRQQHRDQNQTSGRCNEEEEKKEKEDTKTKAQKRKKKNYCAGNTRGPTIESVKCSVCNTSLHSLHTLKKTNECFVFKTLKLDNVLQRSSNDQKVKTTRSLNMFCHTLEF